MKKLVKEKLEFERGLEPSKSLGIGVPPAEWAKRMTDKLKIYGMKSDFTEQSDGNLMDIPSNELIRQGNSNFYNAGLWIGIADKEWYIRSDALDKIIYTQDDGDLDEFVSQVIRFEYDSVKEQIMAISEKLSEK